jgi:hypothetical protein
LMIKEEIPQNLHTHQTATPIAIQPVWL